MSWSQIGGFEVGSAVAFMRQCANEFLATDAARAALIYPTRGGEVSVFACSESDHLVAFFQSIFDQDPERFYRLSREFDGAQQSLRSGNLGWALTRFAGHLFLSLRWANEISVHKVPLQLREQMIALALPLQCYLDCSFIADGLAGSAHQMPQELAVELAS